MAQNTDTLAALVLISAIGKNLVRNNIIQVDDIINDLEELKNALLPGNSVLKLEIENTIRVVSDWEAT